MLFKFAQFSWIVSDTCVLQCFSISYVILCLPTLHRDDK